MNHSVGIIGLGRLGLCLALNLEGVGYDVIGIDQNDSYIESIRNKTLISSEPEVDSYLRKAENLLVTSNYEALFLGNCNIIFIVVATPSLPSGAYDHSQIEKVFDSLEKFGKQETVKHLVINCTTMPGYCDQIAARAKMLNCTLSYNPEFIAQGSIIKDQQYPDQILIGSESETAMGIVEEVYRKLCKNSPTFCKMSLKSAEITKLATNCFLTTKISFANSIGDLAVRAGAEPEKILKAIGSDSRIGGKYLNYGFGYGGPCFPRDNRALARYGDEQGYELLLSKATDEVNKAHLEFQFQEWLHQSLEKAIEFDQVSYKKGTDILEESQQLELAVMLAKAGKKVIIKENIAIISMLKEKYGTLFSYEETK